LKNSKDLLDNLKSRSFSQVSSIKTFDFSTLYTTLPHDKLKTRLKETIHKDFSHRNYGSKFSAYWSLVPRSSMFYLYEFCLKNMWNCSLTQQILSHSFYDWKLCELFLLSGFLICHAVGWYIELLRGTSDQYAGVPHR
jgi:hypothetical protein